MCVPALLFFLLSMIALLLCWKVHIFILLPQLWRRRRKNKCYIKTGLSWSASLVDCKPPSTENKEGGVDRSASASAFADSRGEVLMHEAALTLAGQTWFLQIWCLCVDRGVDARPGSAWRFLFLRVFSTLPDFTRRQLSEHIVPDLGRIQVVLARL